MSKPITFNGRAFLAAYDRLDGLLVANGFPATSPWWREQLERFFITSRTNGRKPRRWVIRAGRRSGKSSTMCRLAVAWALWGAWHVPPGDIGVVAFVSISKDEASSRLRTIGAILRALGVTFQERGDSIELAGQRPALFKVFACNSDAVGFTSIAIFGDEVARWESRDSAANPAAEVSGSLMPSLATQQHGFAAWSSSPWSTDDFHAELFDQGDTDFQVTSYAPTWIANPTMTEQQTHELEPDQRVWSREYLAQPGSTVSAALDPADVLACYDRTPVGLGVSGFVSTDASSLRGDAFTYLAGFETDAGELVIGEVNGWENEQLRHVSMAGIVAQIADRAQAWEVTTVLGDQREEASLRAMFADRGITFRSFAWSEPSKDAAVMLLRRLMRERKIFLPEHAALRRELLGMKARLMPSGRTRYESNGLDYASALITLAHAAEAGEALRGDQRYDPAAEARYDEAVSQLSRRLDPFSSAGPHDDFI